MALAAPAAGVCDSDQSDAEALGGLLSDHAAARRRGSLSSLAPPSAYLRRYAWPLILVPPPAPSDTSDPRTTL